MCVYHVNCLATPATYLVVDSWMIIRYENRLKILNANKKYLNFVRSLKITDSNKFWRHVVRFMGY